MKIDTLLFDRLEDVTNQLDNSSDDIDDSIAMKGDALQYSTDSKVLKDDDDSYKFSSDDKTKQSNCDGSEQE